MAEHEILRNGRGRIRCYHCRWEGEEPSGPWAITWSDWLPDVDGYVPVCYDHSALPHQEFVKALLVRVEEN